MINHVHPALKSLLQMIELTEAAVSGDVQKFVPALVDQSQTEYNKYVNRAAYYDMTGRTAVALVGAMTRRPVQLTGTDTVNVESSDGLSDGLAMMYLSLLETGRVGVLVDFDDEKNEPKLVPYDSDDIVNWSDSFIILKADEIVQDPNDPYITTEESRLLELYLDESGLYAARKWRKLPGATDRWEIIPGSEVTPLFGGRRLAYLPFYSANTTSATIDPHKPPLAVMGALNIQHFNTSVFIAHGSRFFALPKAYISGRLQQVDDGPPTTINLASTDVLMLETGSTANYLEFGGQGGMQFLASERDKLEEQILTLGSRLLTQKSGVESAEAMSLRMGTEAAVLVNMVHAVESMLNMAMEPYGLLARKTITVDLNKDFAGAALSPASTAALLQLYQGGTITLETLLKKLYDGDLVDDPMDELSKLNAPKNAADFMHVIAMKNQGIIDSATAVSEAKRRGILAEDAQVSTSTVPARAGVTATATV